MGFLREFDFSISLIPFATALFGGWVFAFVARYIAHRYSVLAKPSARRRHEAPTPLLGGLAIYLVLASGLAGFYLFGSDVFERPISASHTVMYLGAITVVFLLGLVDDWIELKAPQKLTGELIAAGLVLLSEDNLPVIFQTYGIPAWLGYGAALFWIVGITNAMNLIDGIDGLCSGVAAVVAVGIFAIAPVWSVASFAAAVLAGASVGFFIHNFNPAKIFLGDSGSLLLGFTLSSLIFKIPFKGPVLLSIGVPVFLFGIPILDTALAIYRRATQKRSVFTGDRGHLHHRLQHIGLSARAVTLTLICLQAYAVLAGIVLYQGLPQLGWGTIALAAPAVIIFLKGLKFTEHALSSQSARLSFHYLKDELDTLADLERGRAFLKEQIARYEESGVPFSVVTMDCATYVQQILSHHPTRLVTFFMSLYGALKDRLRSTDMITRPTELRFAVILAGTTPEDKRDAPIFEYLETRLRKLQKEHGIFHGENRKPEGLRIYSYPEDSAKIFRALHVVERKGRQKRAA